MEILGTTFIVTRIILLPMDIMLEYKKLVGKIFKLYISYCSMKFKKGMGERALSDLQNQQNSFKSGIIRLIRGCRNSSVLECQLATPMLVKTVHTRATFVNQAISGGKGKGIKIPRRACLRLEVCVRFIVAEKIKISQH